MKRQMTALLVLLCLGLARAGEPPGGEPPKGEPPKEPGKIVSAKIAADA